MEGKRGGVEFWFRGRGRGGGVAVVEVIGGVRGVRGVE